MVGMLKKKIGSICSKCRIKQTEPSSSALLYQYLKWEEHSILGD
jgi:hypothetical protein